MMIELPPILTWDRMLSPEQSTHTEGTDGWEKDAVTLAM